ncbi:sugar kinase [Caviibacterium pharyngocola]|uniref:2-dehydro-3-deoxygluconokinase n=1 Tax=Caviibacterium pharyngocola TaxID=28159 RepID=A0A2M8RZ55_9PAST|nr:sugar kinase [Caviibacterium pharyngocola]PJG84158.1 ketodeoxygluconokinase [Caviibacterium pharyngocola]
MKKLTLLGECMIELNGEPFGQMLQTYGGDTLNTATYLARVSRRSEIDVQYVSALGTDKLSLAMLAHWRADGINTDLVLLDSQRQPGLYLIQLDAQGERTFLYWRNQSAARYLLQHSDFPKVAEKLAEADALYLSGISLAILPKNDRTLLLELLKQLRAKGIEIIFDSNYRPKLWENAAEAQYYYAELLKMVDVALVTFDDEQLLWGDLNEQASLERLASYGIGKIVLKQGKCGAILWQNGKQEPVSTIAVENVVDTTSAGDAFNAGFLQGYLSGKDLVTCCQQGNQLAGIVIQHKGAIIPKSATAHLLEKFN